MAGRLEITTHIGCPIDCKDCPQELLKLRYKGRRDLSLQDHKLRKAGLDRNTCLRLPYIDKELYFYNFLREGSNMYRSLVLHEAI